MISFSPGTIVIRCRISQPETKHSRTRTCIHRNFAVTGMCQQSDQFDQFDQPIPSNFPGTSLNRQHVIVAVPVSWCMYVCGRCRLVHVCMATLHMLPDGVWCPQTCTSTYVRQLQNTQAAVWQVCTSPLSNHGITCLQQSLQHPIRYSPA